MIDFQNFFLNNYFNELFCQSTQCILLVFENNFQHMNDLNFLLLFNQRTEAFSWFHGTVGFTNVPPCVGFVRWLLGGIFVKPLFPVFLIVSQSKESKIVTNQNVKEYSDLLEYQMRVCFL